MNIDVTFDQSVSSLPAGFVSAVNGVVNYFDILFTNPVTINIDVGYGEIDGMPLAPNDLGASYAPYVMESYSSVRQALQSEGAPGSSTLPSASPLSGFLLMTQAEAQALGLTSAVSTSYVGFSSALPFSYTVDSTPASGEYYFIGVVAHEFTEDMGRVSFIDDQPLIYSVMDLFRYSAPGVRDQSAGGGGSIAYFSIDNGNTDLGSWNDNPRNGDLGDWNGNSIPNGGKDAFSDYSSSGVVNAISSTDLTLMETLGWTETSNRSAILTLLVQHIAASFAPAIDGHVSPLIRDLAVIAEVNLAHPHA